MRRAIVFVAASLRLGLAWTPQWPAPSTEDNRDIIIQTLDSGAVALATGCEEHRGTLYNTGPEVDLEDREGNDCIGDAYEGPAPLVIDLGSEAALYDSTCDYVAIDFNNGVAATLYGETNGQSGLQRSADPAGAFAADQYCALP
ncbi:MAG: hypothetical protein ACPGQL_04870 [Thermoplasmatota archaeon]